MLGRGSLASCTPDRYENAMSSRKALGRPSHLRRARWSGLVMAFVAACSDEKAATDGHSTAFDVHGLGVNPADRSLYAATHSGVYRIEGGEARRQGTLTQDTMGFVIAGPNRFFGSGHPDPHADTILRPGMRPRLGLIESADQGTSWRGLSLQGEVDFHALAFAQNAVYGSDSSTGRFMVSSDLQQWETRSQPNLVSFTISPSDARRIVGVSSDQSVVQSTDGGRTWATVSSAGAFALVSWNAKHGLWGVGVSGAVLRSVDDGSTWTRVGAVAGSPTALFVDDAELFVAMRDGVYHSNDEGATWSAVYKVN